MTSIERACTLRGYMKQEMIDHSYNLNEFAKVISAAGDDAPSAMAVKAFMSGIMTLDQIPFGAACYLLKRYGMITI